MGLEHNFDTEPGRMIERSIEKIKEELAETTDEEKRAQLEAALAELKNKIVN